MTSVLAHLANYEKDLRKKAMDLCKDLATEAKIKAESEYAAYDAYDSGDYVKVTVDPIQQGVWHRGYQTVAEGNSKKAQDGLIGNTVVFAEFGSGTAAGVHPLSSEYGYYPGSWSEHDQREFVNFDYWEHNKKIRTQVKPTMAMFKAAVDARTKIINRVIKAFRGEDSKS